MIQNFFKVVFPVSVIFTVLNILSTLSGLSPKLLSWSITVVDKFYLGKIAPIFTSLLLLSLGYFLVKKIYNERVEGYDDARHLALASIFAIPFIPIIFSPGMLYPYITGKAFGFRFLSVVLFFTVIYLSFTNKNFRLRVTPLTVTMTFFTVLIGVSDLFGGNFFKAFWGNFERMDGYFALISIWSLVLSLTSLRLKELEWFKLGKIHVAVASFVTGIGFLQYLLGIFKVSAVASLPILGQCIPMGIQGVGTYCKVDSTLGNSIYLGIYGGLTAWLIIYYIVKKNWQVNYWVWVAFILNLITPIVLTTTRSVWVGIAAGVLSSLLVYFWLTKNRKYGSITLLVTTILLALVAIFTYYQDSSFVQSIPFFGRLFNVNTLFARWNVWQIALVSFLQNPIFGWGQESFMNAFNINFNPAMYGQEVYFDHPHNAYIGWLFMGGLLGFLAYLSTLVAGFYGSFKTYSLESEDKNNTKNKMVFAVVVGTVVTYLVHSIFVFDNLVTSVLFAFILVYFGRNYSNGNLILGNIAEGAKKIFVGILSLLAIIVLFFSFWKPIYANKVLIDAMTYENKATTPIDAINGTRALFEKALSFNTFANYEISEQFLQKSLRYESIAAQTKDESIKMAIKDFKTSAITSFTNHVSLHPEDHRSRFALGLYYTSLSEFENAKKYLTEAYNLAPNKQIAILSLAKVLLVKGEKDEAFKLYKKALDVTPKPTKLTSNLNSQYNNLRIEYVKALMLDGRDDEALKVIQEMLPVSTASDFQNLVNNMMQIYAARKDLKGVVSLLVDAIKLNPTNPNYYIWLGQALAYGGNYTEAVQVVSSLNSQYPQVVAEFVKQIQVLVNQKNNVQ